MFLKYRAGFHTKKSANIGFTASFVQHRWQAKYSYSGTQNALSAIHAACFFLLFPVHLISTDSLRTV